MPEMSNQEEAIQMKGKMREKALLGQIAHLLVAESLINPDEQIRFLALLKEEN